MTSSQVSRVGSPVGGLGMLRLLTTTGRSPSSVDWSTRVFIQAPPRLRLAAYRVADEQAEAGAVLVEDLEDADVGVVAGEVVALGEA